MKKIIAVVALVACTAGVGHAINAVTWTKQGASGSIDLGTNTPAGTNPYLTVKPSANVFMAYNAEANGVGYSVGSYHGQGSRAFATSSIDTNLYYKEFSSGAAQGVDTATTQNQIPAVATALDGTGFTGWTASK